MTPRTLLLKSNLLDKYTLISKKQACLIYGFTTRLAGDFRHDNIKKLGKLFKINPKNIITMSQVHGSAVGLLGGGPKGLPRGGRHVDGMITTLKNKFLAVKVADCVPILFYDPHQEIAAACHVGWKGTLERIQQKIIQKMQRIGSKPENIIAVLGPHIGSCCYNISSDRAKDFKEYLTIKNGEFFLDLGKTNISLLKKVGVNNIEDINICTSCQNDLLYSYRKEGPHHGEQVGLIGML